MRILNLIFLLLILLVSCKNQPGDKNKQAYKKITQSKDIVSKEKIYDVKCAILYMPDSIQLSILEKEKSQEELNEIEYDKALAVEFLDSRNIPVFIEDKKDYKFRKKSGEIMEIDKTSFPNLGIIFFTPDKSPKVVFLNEVAEEYELYFFN